MSPIEAFLCEVPPLFENQHHIQIVCVGRVVLGLLAHRINCSGAELALVLAKKAAGIGRMNRVQFW